MTAIINDNKTGPLGMCYRTERFLAVPSAAHVSQVTTTTNHFPNIRKFHNLEGNC